MLPRLREQLTEPKMPQLVLRIVAGHLAKLSDAVLKLTHGALPEANSKNQIPESKIHFQELFLGIGSWNLGSWILGLRLTYFESYTVIGNDNSAVFLPITSVAFNLTVNFPARLSGSQNCMGAYEN